MTDAATALSTSHLTVAAAAFVLLIGTAIWFAAAKSKTGKRNLITGTLLALIGIGVYPVIFQKHSPQEDKESSDIEKTGETILISKTTPMRHENGEPTSNPQIWSAQACLRSAACEACLARQASDPSAPPLPTDDPHAANTDLPHPGIFLTARLHTSPAPQCAILTERTISAELALLSAVHL